MHFIVQARAHGDCACHCTGQEHQHQGGEYTWILPGGTLGRKHKGYSWKLARSTSTASRRCCCRLSRTAPASAASAFTLSVAAAGGSAAILWSPTSLVTR